MYAVEGCQLRVCKSLLTGNKMAQRIAGARLILLQHALQDTVSFVKLIRATGAAIHRFIAKPFSIDAVAYSQIEEMCPCEIADYENLDSSDRIPELLKEAEELSRADSRPIVILEVGGYFAKHLRKLSLQEFSHLRGVVEVTTFGHNRYLEAAEEIPVPIYSVARSPIKNIEARYVGRAVVVALDGILRSLGVSVAGRRALVIGFGMIGSNVAEALRDNHVAVSVCDKAGFPRLDAFTRGFAAGGSKDLLLADADLVVASTAQKCMTFEDIENCKDKALLVSAGSRGSEFDVAGLEERSIDKRRISAEVVYYQVSACKGVYLVREGKAVNFLVKSCPDEVVDLIHAEVLVCLDMILNDHRKRTRLQQVNSLPIDDLHGISRDWLRHLT